MAGDLRNAEKNLRNAENLERDTGSSPNKSSSNGVSFCWARVKVLLNINQLCFDSGKKFISIPASLLRSASLLFGLLGAAVDVSRDIYMLVILYCINTSWVKI